LIQQCEGARKASFERLEDPFFWPKPVQQRNGLILFK
jgi:hypothetical protein